MILLYGFALYVLCGAVTGLGFVMFGLAQVLPPAARVTAGARILILPGAAALWPYVLFRWLRGRDA
jgi:hypothetical protein